MLYIIMWEIAALYSVIATLCMVFAAFACICGCKARERKDELVGLEGHVKMTNPEVAEVSVANGTAQRSLPELPEADVSWEPSGDAASELYATVGAHKLAKLPSTPSPNKAKDHPYDKLQGIEHPYAQVNAVDGPSTSQDNITSDIPAATAIAGHVHASEELPYMTPPAHFSGDSQDSSKGYTSISVREPLAAIRSETVEVSAELNEARDEHYATVSDDSDDMYAAIEEPANDTYAQLRPTQTTVDTLRSQSHSRQESSSSATSSGAVNSPKPEKRQANSPLPAPPAADRNLDEMYAKVNKKRNKHAASELLQRGPSTESAVSGSSESVSYKLQTDTSQSTSSTSASDSSAPNTRELALAVSAPGQSTDSSLSSDPDKDPCYESLAGAPEQCYNYNCAEPAMEPNYETLGKDPPSDSDPNYEWIGQVQEPPYASVMGEPPYARLAGEPDYESVQYQHVEPPYQLLKDCETGVTKNVANSE